MASNVTAQSVLDKISAGHLECTICFDRFKEPKLLNCFHSFCLKCLQDLRQGQDPDSKKLPCPLCRRATLLQDKEVADLPTNFTLAALVEEFTLQERLLEGQESDIKCQACDEGNQATSRCMDCDHFLCQECHKQHGRMALMKSHTIYALAQLQSGEVAYKSKLREVVPKCKKHPDQSLSIYCSTCELLVCMTCSLLDHGKHSFTGPSEAVEECKRDVAELVEEAVKNKTVLISALTETNKSRKMLENMFANIHMKISTKADKEVKRIRDEERKLHQELEKTFKERVKPFEAATSATMEEVTEAEQKLEEVNRLIDEGSCYEILSLKHKVMRNLREMTVKQPEAVPGGLSFMDFEEGERSLGRLVLEPEDKPDTELQPKAQGPPKAETLHLGDNWQLNTQTETFGTKKREFLCVHDVAAFSDGEIVLVDTKHKQLFTRSKSQPPTISETLKLKGHADSATQISVNKTDHLILLHGAAVQIFDSKYHLLHQFKPGRGSDGKPSCLAVDENNLIAVGFQDRKEIALHKPNGFLIMVLPAPMMGGYLTTNNQRFIYTNQERKKLLAVTYEGSMVFEVDVKGKKIAGPTGVSCDSDGSIYVAVRSPSIKGGIYQFSPDGKYLRCVIEKCGSPCGITFTPDGKLVVAAEQSFQIYHRT